VNKPFPLALAIACAFLVLGCLGAAPPALSSFPARDGAVWSPDCCGRPIVREEPRYPEEALRHGQTGWVIVSGILDARGWISDPVVLASDPAGVFDAAAAKAFDAWRYAAPPAGSARREVREVIRFERPRAHPSMPSDTGGAGGGGGGYGY
jgi:TonB family protein